MLRVLRSQLAFIGLCVVSCGALQAMPVDQYLRLRRQLQFDPRLTLSTVQSSPAAYARRVFEVRGTVSGSIQNDSKVSFLLSMPDKSTVLLASPKDDAGLMADVNHPRLRILVRVVEPSVVSNRAVIEPLAAAFDADVTFREQAASASEAAARARRSQQPAPSAPVTVSAGGGYKLRAGPSVQRGVSLLARRYLSPEAQAIYPHYMAFISRCNKRLSPEETDQIAVSLLYFAQRHQVDPRLVVSLIIAESDFNPQSTSHKGAMGLGQVMPDEARSFKLTNPYDPIQNIRASVNMMRMKLDIYREAGVPKGQLTWRQVSLMLAAYNAGSGAVRKYGGVPPYRETQGYVKRVLSLYRRLCGI